MNPLFFTLYRYYLQEFSAGSPCLVSRSVLQLLYSPLQSLSSPSSSCYPASSPSSSSSSLTLNTSQPVVLLQEVLREACKNFIVPPALLPPPPKSPGQAPSPIHSLQVTAAPDVYQWFGSAFFIMHSNVWQLFLLIPVYFYSKYSKICLSLNLGPMWLKI